MSKAPMAPPCTRPPRKLAQNSLFNDTTAGSINPPRISSVQNILDGPLFSGDKRQISENRTSNVNAVTIPFTKVGAGAVPNEGQNSSLTGSAGAGTNIPTIDFFKHFNRMNAKNQNQNPNRMFLPMAHRVGAPSALTRSVSEAADIGELAKTKAAPSERRSGGSRSNRSNRPLMSFPTGDASIDRYIGIKRIGAGTFADIWEVYDQYDPQRKHWALKVLKAGKYRRTRRDSNGFDVDHCKLMKYESAMISEGNRIRKLNKQDWNERVPLIRCKEVLTDNSLHSASVLRNGGGNPMTMGMRSSIKPCIVLELMGISLLQYIQLYERKKMVIGLKTVRAIAVQLFAAMSFLHGQGGYIHADLKPENVLITLDHSINGNIWSNTHPKIKVVDLGNALSYNRNINTFEVQSLYYRAPEVLFGNEMSASIDMWSIGCILVELININEFNSKDKFAVTKRSVKDTENSNGGMRSIIASTQKSQFAANGTADPQTPVSGPVKNQLFQLRRDGAGSKPPSNLRSKSTTFAGVRTPSRRRPTRRAHHALLDCRSTSGLARKIHSVLCPFPAFVFNPYYSFHFDQMAGAFPPPLKMTEFNTSYAAMKETRKQRLLDRLSIPDVGATEYKLFLDLIAGLLDLDPATRYSSEDAIQHPFCIDSKYLDSTVKELMNNTFDSAYPIISILSDEDRQHRVNQEVHQYQILVSIAARNPANAPIPRQHALTCKDSAFTVAFADTAPRKVQMHNRAICALRGCCPTPTTIESVTNEYFEGESSPTPPMPPNKKIKLIL